MRSFIACDIFHDKITKVIEDIRTTNAAIKYTCPNRTHITLKFLGEIKEGSVEAIGEILKMSCIDIQPMEATLSGVGVFPNQDYMRVIWIGLECPEMEKLQHTLDGNLSKLGFKMEKEWKPHLTIGRIRSAGNNDHLKAAVERLKNIELGTVTVDTVRLKKSELTPEGPIYTDIKEVML